MRVWAFILWASLGIITPSRTEPAGSTRAFLSSTPLTPLSLVELQVTP